MGSLAAEPHTHFKDSKLCNISFIQNAPFRYPLNKLMGFSNFDSQISSGVRFLHEMDIAIKKPMVKNGLYLFP